MTVLCTQIVNERAVPTLVIASEVHVLVNGSIAYIFVNARAVVVDKGNVAFTCKYHVTDRRLFSDRNCLEQTFIGC